MSRTTITIVKDDLTDEEGAETVSFSVDGVAYQIDLTDDSKRKMDEVLFPYITNGRRVGKMGTSAPAPTQRLQRVSQRTDRSYMLRVKAWAAEQKIYVPPRGRIPNAVYTAYKDAGGK